jgi:predicted anti-sigma-YlaC factor YlaD
MIERLLNGSCDETRESLSDHLEGELRGLRRWRIRRHLSRCDRCREVLRSLTHAVEQLRSLGPNAGVGVPVADAVLSRIRHERA